MPVILGCSALTLTQEEIQFFKEHKPYGFILFRRNIESPTQLKRLVDQLRDTVGWQCPILIDQEGGRVARLKPSHWPEFPSMKQLVDSADSNISDVTHVVSDNAYKLGQMLTQLGINVNCAPVCDLHIEGAHDIVGDRSFGSDPTFVAKCATAMCEGLQKAGVIPIIKHIPGHGRAHVDSHEDLPVVDAPLDVLEKTDFNVFKQMARSVKDVWAMTAHITYTALDPDLPATISPSVIHYIREHIGFDGLLITDDLSMKALTGDLGELALKALEAGCDIALHCNGDMQEMKSVVSKLNSKSHV